MNGHKALIVGASGQVGNKIAEALGKNTVVCAGRAQKDGWLEIDLTKITNSSGHISRFLEERHIGVVYCVGGATDVERCESDEPWAMQTNNHGPAALASLCAHIPFVYFSTEYVFDGAQGPYTETSPKTPVSVYGLSKSLGEEAILAAHPSALVLRTTVVYGEDPGEKNFLYSLMRKLKSGQEMFVPNDQRSTPTYNRDLAYASIALVNAAQRGIFHVSGPELLSRYEFAVQAANHLELDATKIIGIATSSLKQAARRPLDAGLTIDKLTQTLPELKMRTLAEGLQDWFGIAAPTRG